MASLFISYSRKDKEAARKLTEAFQSQDMDFWIDWEGIPPTVDWWKEIEKGIEEADIFLFLLSPNSASSKVCKRELEHAFQNGKRLIPVVIRDILSDESPAELRPLNWIFLRESEDFQISFEKLIQAVKTDYVWVQAHRRLQVRALEWERSNKDNSFLLRGKDLQDAEQHLVIYAGKSPQSTNLQQEYILSSRQVVDRQRRTITSIAIAGTIIMTVLAVFGFVQARLAQERATISRAGQLAAQSIALQDKNFPVSLLLAVDAFNTLDTVQTRGALLDNAQANPQLLAYLSGFADAAGTVAFSPDGKILAAGGNDGRIVLWDVESRQLIGQPLVGHTSSVSSISFSPDGNTLAAGSSDQTIILWDVESRQPIGQPLSGHSGGVITVAFSPDGKTLASGGYDGTIILWDMETGQVIGQPLAEHSYWVSSVAFSPDGKILASGSYDETIILWDVRTRQPIGEPLNGNAFFVTSVAFSPDGKILAAGNFDSTVILWDVETRRPIGQPLSGHANEIYSVAFSPDGKTLASGSLDTTILLWEVTTRQMIGQPLSGHTDTVSSLSFSPDGSYLASGSWDSTISLWAMRKTPPLGQVIGEHTDAVSGIDISPDGKILASGSWDGTISLWDMKTEKSIDQLSSMQNIAVIEVIFSPDGKMIASSNSEGSIILWDAKTRQTVGQPLIGHVDGVNTIAFSPDGKMLASGGEDQTIIFWDTQTAQRIGEPLSGHTDSVRSVAFSPDGKILASGSNDKNIILWDMKTREPIGQPLRGHTIFVTRVVFSPDGKTLASASTDRTIILWDVEARKSTGQPLAGHKDLVLSIDFSPDGKILASSSADDTILLWDMETRQLIGPALIGHTAYVRSVVFSPDGKMLASGSDDNTIRLWNMDPLSWNQKTCQRVGRNFTDLEWAQYFPDETYVKTCEQFPNHPSYYRAIAKEIISESDSTPNLQNVLDRVRREMERDASIEEPEVEAVGIVGKVIMESVLTWIDSRDWKKPLDLLKQPTINDLLLDSFLKDPQLLNKFCWGASLDGFAKQVLEYCEQAVGLAPDDAGIHDSRGLARALTGDFAGAIDDFRFFIDSGEYDESFVQERQQWVIDLYHGINPFTPEILEQLKNE
jgi:WD40 repeat protein